MFTFLTRLGRLAIAIPVGIVVVTVLGYTTLTMLPAASRHQAASAASCAVSSAGVGQALTVNGHGLAASTQYLLYIATPAGSGGTTANTDSTGSFTYTSVAGWSGRYSASVWTEGGGSKEVAACSLTL